MQTNDESCTSMIHISCQIVPGPSPKFNVFDSTPTILTSTGCILTSVYIYFFKQLWEENIFIRLSQPTELPNILNNYYKTWKFSIVLYKHYVAHLHLIVWMDFLAILWMESHCLWVLDALIFLAANKSIAMWKFNCSFITNKRFFSVEVTESADSLLSCVNFGDKCWFSLRMKTTFLMTHLWQES